MCTNDKPKEYIERGALLKKIQWVTEYDETGCGIEYRAVSEKEIKNVPAADVVKVVRCGNCKHWASYRAAKYGRCMCVEEIAEGQWHTQADDFCSHGERKEE